ncbi:prepilin-type N-terminal cleavage/methylation domain-containing protein [Clostridium sp. LQ25]|uniref:prepilin-type N-terminal cleavage/methylation domain-containing protein n=1 Tax=Clostridium sp. LQ25 TaxID=2992805 RepID=UPI0022534D98|nr:prepilin-type N-terminal cleavage/methylation domain-containing protein [Clostridium sp. LQ25]UZT07221.1 prepilin-type N-terminal cleavage/methylation domain-containing protein [Clostridium sp. LQ25]
MNKLSLRTLVKNRKKKGFTLVELIIVIAIIAILAAIAIPKFGQITKNSNITADIATAKNLHGIGAQIVAEDPSILTADDNTLTGVAAKVDGGTMPKSKVKNADFSVHASKDGDITVKVGDEEVYPTAGDSFKKAS